MHPAEALTRSTTQGLRATKSGMSEVLSARLEALEGPPLLLVELPAEGGGLDLLIYDEAGRLVDVSYVPAELMDDATVEAC